MGVLRGVALHSLAFAGGLLEACVRVPIDPAQASLQIGDAAVDVAGAIQVGPGIVLK